MQLFQCRKKSKRDLLKFAWYPSTALSEFDPNKRYNPAEAADLNFRILAEHIAMVGTSVDRQQVIDMLRDIRDRCAETTGKK